MNELRGFRAPDDTSAVALVEFLRARLDEDERDANEFDRSDRILREVTAKRLIITEHKPRQERVGYRAGEPVIEWTCPTCVYIGDDEDAGGNMFRDLEHDTAPCITLRLLALPHSDHPDYRQEWAQ